MQQDDPGDSILSLPALKRRSDRSDVALILADAIRVQLLTATPNEAELAVENALERLRASGFEIRRI